MAFFIPVIYMALVRSTTTSDKWSLTERNEVIKGIKNYVASCTRVASNVGAMTCRSLIHVF